MAPPDGKRPVAAASPLIPEHVLDIPSQRLFILSLGALCQAVKAFDIVYYLASGDSTICRKWLLVDLVYCIVLAKLRIPRLNYSIAIVLLQITGLWLMDGFLFGGIRLNISLLPFVGSSAGIADTSEPFSILTIIAPLTFGLLGKPEYAITDNHLMGQHTIRMSPISTARLNPTSTRFCLFSPSQPILIPILLNNTNPIAIRYSLTPMGTDREQSPNEVEYIDLSTKELKAIERARLETLQIVKEAAAKRDADEYDEYDDDDDEPVARKHNSLDTLQTTQTLVHLRLSKPGVIRLERVVDASNVEARLAYPAEVTVARCPHVEFAPDTHHENNVRCAGQNPGADLMLDISGVPPLSLRWYKYINGIRTDYVVDGIQGTAKPQGSKSASRIGVPEQVKIPLAISLDKTGTHLYGLQEISDAVGNIVRVETVEDHSQEVSKYTRTFRVLNRPTMSFKDCRAGNPTSILIGSEANLPLVMDSGHTLDGPWEAVVKYRPPPQEKEIGDNKRLYPWQKTLTTTDKSLSLKAGAPGEYTLVGLKGKHCEGDVLAPDTCTVVERPKPYAEIEWKRIHECSGDTGVSASFTLHGTPPFKVYYRSQRDNEPPRDHPAETFTTSRGEFTVQPESSGHYVFSFTRITDAYYQVPLDGPSIDQVIHPLASAEFASGSNSRRKRTMNSCQGSVVPVVVDLRGTGPWTLELQVVGPKTSDTITISDIETPRKELEVAIPKFIDENGGTFDIAIASIEDKYKCKRTLSTPGLSVNVRRVKSTVRFYGDNAKRHISALEGETVELPLRLTGDGGWTVKYRRKEAENIVYTAKLATPNAALKVTKSGLYEIISVEDSQCGGSVLADASTYQVDWVPRPSAKLAETTVAIVEPFNSSSILPPICENVEGHVDLDLVGRPPFQIMYNVAQGTDNGGTKILDQPTFNSIQHRTRFMLQTSHASRMYYEVKQIGDAAYPISRNDAVLPRSERLLFEQQVMMRPSAQFKNSNRMSYCLYDKFEPQNGLSSDATVIFEGTPPFKLKVFIKNVISSKADVLHIETTDAHWKLNFPDYTFQSVGPHQVTIKSVSDASNCAHAALDPLATSIWVDVAETAAIVPFDRREDYCVGEVSQFQLEGIPPWTIGYRVNTKAHTHEAKISPFSFKHQSPGDFIVTSISHQQKLCKAAVADLHVSVHPLPSAQIGHGKRVFQDIHEGDQAEIVFTLIGEPPFTFTYQRSEVSQGRGKPGKVLETHTVSRVFSKEYSIFSALEGTWTVTSISDKYCRYPPAQAEPANDKQKRLT